MNGIIKSAALDALGSVRPIGAAPMAARRTVEEEEGEHLRRRIAELERELGRRDEGIAALRVDVEEAFERGTAEGRKAGLGEAEDRQSERLALLEGALETAAAELRERLAAMERFAVLMARECLDVMLGDPEWRIELVCGLIRKQMAEIERSALLQVEVSAKDFPDDAALAGLASKVGVSPEVVANRGDLATGDCTMTLRLGRMEIGLRQQWETLREALDEMAASGDAA